MTMTGILKLAFDGVEQDILDVLRVAVADYIPHIVIIDQTDMADIVMTQKDLVVNNPLKVGYYLDKIEETVFHRHRGHAMSYKEYALLYSDCRVRIDDQTFDLSERERDLMAELILAGDTGCTRDHLLTKIWGYRPDLDTHALETQIYRLRQKIETMPDQPCYLITIEGGYKLV